MVKSWNSMDIKQVKVNLQKPVLYEGRVYTLPEYILWADISGKKIELRHSLTLLDKNGNRTIRAPLDKVEAISDEGSV